MSYDVAYWKAKPSCKFSAYAIYCRLRRGLDVEGLAALPVKKVRAALLKIVTDQEEDDGVLLAAIGDCGVEIRVSNSAVLVDFREVTEEALDRVRLTLKELGLVDFDPQEYQGNDEELLDDDTYFYKSGDPDPGYWTSVDFVPCSPGDPQVQGCGPCSIQRVGQTTYVLIETGHDKGAFRVADAVVEGRCNFSRAYNGGCGNLSEGCPFVVIVLLPQTLFLTLSAGASPRMHCTVFCAFGFNSRPTAYAEGRPNEQGEFAGIFSFRERPSRLKTMVSTKYVYRG